MTTKHDPCESIDGYIVGFPEPIRALLQELRAAIRAGAPEAVEKISYGMPTYALHGNLVHFAAHAHHIGFYPTPSGIAAFAEELACYKSSKGAVQFPFDRPLPLDLIRRIVEFRVEENRAAALARRSRKQS